MTPPISSPLSSNSPSSPTSKGYDENNFPLQPSWPREPARNGSITKVTAPVKTKVVPSGPFSVTNPQHLMSPSEGWKVQESSPGSGALPPRSSSSPRTLQSSPNRASNKPSQTIREPVAMTKAVDPRNALTPRTNERPPPMDPDSAIARRTARNPPDVVRDTNRARDSPSIHSQTSGPGDWQWEQNNDPDDQEQALFEQRLCEDIYGVAVRKINQNGKSNLRYVKCCYLEASELEGDSGATSSNRSTSNRSNSSSHSRRFTFRRDRSIDRSECNERTEAQKTVISAKKVQVLVWGKKKDVRIPTNRFVCVRKGKTTDRTRRNVCPASHILSLITDDPHNPSLDIEAPTRLDRDKFARAFSRFLRIPLEGDDVRSIRSELTPQSIKGKPSQSQNLRQQLAPQNSVPDLTGTHTESSQATNNSRKHIPLPVVTTDGEQQHPPLPAQKHIVSPIARKAQPIANEGLSNTADISDPVIRSLPSTISNLDSNADIHKITSSWKEASQPDKGDSEISQPGTSKVHLDPEEDGSVVSSITGGGYDQEIVEELHMALTELRAELEASRAEAARAVKVAEQAIQSAEKSNSKDWNSTVTHKAAEAAALAQKKSAEAMAKARVAEERLETERKNAAMWKKQAEAAEEEAGHWQTRAAAAEVQRAAIAEALESEREQAAMMVSSKKQVSSPSRSLDSEGKSAVELELEFMRESLRKKTERLALESASRRRLLHEVQDLRGAVRVYCRPRYVPEALSTISTPSREVLLLHRDRNGFQKDGLVNTSPLSFEFDGILGADLRQQDVYDEMEELCLGVLDGYNVCIMTYGQSGAGKTYTMLGEVEYTRDGEVVEINDHGIHLRAVHQFFTVLQHRSERYKDVVKFNLVEVVNERLSDLLAGTEIGELHGLVEVSRRKNRKTNDSQDGSAASQNSRPTKLEIKTNRDGETVVHGLISVEVSSFDDVYKAWKECLTKRAARLKELGVDFGEHEANSHLIATLKVLSTNITTGLVTYGKIQFVDLAASNIVPKIPSGTTNKKVSTPESAMSGVDSSQEWKYANKSLSTLDEVVTARSQFQRSVPYRNSTITHLLSDSLEADTKVALVACISPEPTDIQETTCTLRFAEKLRKVVVGKATKHALAHA